MHSSEKKLPARLQQIARDHPGQEIQVWFQDAPGTARLGHFRGQGTLTRVWAKKGSRPRAVKQTRYDWVHVLAGVCPATGQAVGLISPTLNPDAVNRFFDQFVKKVDPKVHGVMLWDQAGFHTSGKVKVPPNVTVIELPPKSPELNPVENLWHYRREHHWANTAHADYDHLRQAACDAWQCSVLQPEVVQSVCNAPYANVS